MQPQKATKHMQDLMNLQKDVCTILAKCASNSIPGSGKAIASHCYLEMGSDLRRYERARGAMAAKGLITYTTEVVTLTTRGEKLLSDLLSD